MTNVTATNNIIKYIYNELISLNNNYKLVETPKAEYFKVSNYLGDNKYEVLAEQTINTKTLHIISTIDENIKIVRDGDKIKIKGVGDDYSDRGYKRSSTINTKITDYINTLNKIKSISKMKI